MAPRYQLRDSFGRKIDNIRISVTDRCNFRCRYCMPEEGMTWLGHAEILTYEEIARVVRILVSMGVRKVRLTGGEPLMRKELPGLVERLHAISGLEDIALTTNGYFLAEQAESLARAGLRRINVSLDSLDPATFEAMARRNHLDRVLAGIETALACGIGPVKLNVVLIRGINDGEIGGFAALARTRPFVVRFIEFMPIGSGDGWSNDRVVTTGEVLSTLERLGYETVPLGENGTHPAERYRFADGKGEIGFISSVSHPFCASCNRIRLTSDGKLRTCLFSLGETDIKGPLRAGAGDDDIRAIVEAAVATKEAGHLINQPDFVRPGRTMSSIGG
ncbi:MAG TPA: GTP 3',8-cyclase MoaA [Bacteroidota bacterium]|nr:GTP 3',8-cyclase MoaA [Bacteroidota bacterium]